MARILVRSALVALVITLATASPALAYIDPSAGGLMFQLLAAAFAVFSGVILVFSRQIRAGFGRARRLLRSLCKRGSKHVPHAITHREGQETQEDTR